MKIHPTDTVKTTEEITSLLEKQYEAVSSSFAPSTVNVYIATRSAFLGETNLKAYQSHCIFSKEHALTVAAREYASWLPTVLECFSKDEKWIQQYLVIEFDNQFATDKEIAE